MTASVHVNGEGVAGGEAAGYPSAARAWYGVCIFYVAYSLAFVDRQIMAFLVGPIRADFHLTDFQFSLIHGLAFVIFYSFLGVPIARLADVSSRRYIITAGIALWSVMTALCGLTTTYVQLFLARLGVGFGEGALSPAAISVISDSFPPARRALPIGIYSAGVHGGAGIASLCGGLVVAYAMNRGTVAVPLLGALRPWQLALVIVGLPGLLVALAALTVREPARRETLGAGARLPLRQVLQQLSRQGALYASLMVGAGLSSLASYGCFSWVPAMYQRTFGWGPGQTGVAFGLVTLVFGTAGLLISGALVGRMTAAGVRAPCSKVMVVSMALAVVPAALLVAGPGPWWTLGCLALVVAFMSTPIGLTQTALQELTPNQMRAQVIAIYLLVTAFFGAAAGPATVAALTDYLFHDDARVGASMAIVASVTAALSTLILWLGIAAYPVKPAENAS